MLLFSQKVTKIIVLRVETQPLETKKKINQTILMLEIVHTIEVPAIKVIPKMVVDNMAMRLHLILVKMPKEDLIIAIYLAANLINSLMCNRFRPTMVNNSNNQCNLIRKICQSIFTQHHVCIDHFVKSDDVVFVHGDGYNTPTEATSCDFIHFNFL